MASLFTPIIRRFLGGGKDSPPGKEFQKLVGEWGAKGVAFHAAVDDGSVFANATEFRVYSNSCLLFQRMFLYLKKSNNLLPRIDVLDDLPVCWPKCAKMLLRILCQINYSLLQ